MDSTLSTPTTIPSSIEARPSTYVVQGAPSSARIEWFRRGVEDQLVRNGHAAPPGDESPGLVLNFVDARRPRPYRRKAQGTFVITVVEVEEASENLLRAAYPVLVRSLSNLLVYITGRGAETVTHMVTLEQGYYTIEAPASHPEEYFAEVYRRIAPLASSRLVINNVFQPDLPRAMWEGDERTRELFEAGRWLDEMNLLPAAFPIAELLSDREMHHVKRLFGIGGLSYGNLSTRCDASSFWMSARGVDKGNLREIGRDILLITGYQQDENAMVVSVPPGVEPRAASVDAVEHWLLYMEHPGIGAIIHIHAWMEGIPSTSVNYPCGTYQLAQEVADLVRAEPDPTRAVIGLRNHGLTITGRSLADIIERIDGRILRQVPMI
jgi:ribulose-5-phosphate 4-epimerase/fuculose-1-phosphate aldolase